MSSPRNEYSVSKSRARRLSLQQREVNRVKCELSAIAELAKGIRDEAQLRQVLADIEDDEMRIAVSKLIEPFLLFRIQRVES